MRKKTTFGKTFAPNRYFKQNFSILICFLFLFGKAQTYTFTGGGDGTSWTDPANWSGAAGIPYIDDTSCNVDIGSYAVSISSSASLTMDSGTVSGTGKITNNGTFTVNTAGTKYFTLSTFENKGSFILGDGSNISAYVYLQNSTLFDNTSTGEVVFNGVVFYSSGSHTVQNKGIIRKSGDFSDVTNATM